MTPNTATSRQADLDIQILSYNAWFQVPVCLDDWNPDKLEFQ